MNSHYKIRNAKSTDSDAITKLIAGVFDEYDWVFDAEEEIPDIVHFDQFYPKDSLLPQLKVATTLDDKVVACAGLKPDNRGVYLSRIYVTKSHRRQGLARYLIDELLETANAQQIHYVHLWTDTLFTDAHLLYERLEFVYTGHIRPLNDANGCYEYHYERLL